MEVAERLVPFQSAIPGSRNGQLSLKDARRQTHEPSRTPRPKRLTFRPRSHLQVVTGVVSSACGGVSGATVRRPRVPAATPSARRPKGVTEAARRLGVTRVALSRLL